MCPPWAVSNSATLGRPWTIVSGKAVRTGNAMKRETEADRNPQLQYALYKMSLKAYHRLLLLLTLSTVLTILGREGVISSVETQDGYCSVREFFVWAGIMVVVHTRFVTENQRCEAFVKLTDGLCLEGREGGQEMRRKAEITNYENKVTVKSSVYRQDMVHIHYFLQNLPVPVRNKFKGSTLPIGRTKFIHL